MRLRAFAYLFAAMVCIPVTAVAQAPGSAGPSSSMFSNLANPAIGMNSLFKWQAAHNLDQA